MGDPAGVSNGTLDPKDAGVQWPNDLGFDSLREEKTPISLKVSGNIPSYAAGSIYRNGPGASEIKNAKGEVIFKWAHWFDGFGQLHKFELLPGPDGKVIQEIKYTCRNSVDSLMQEIATTGRYEGYSFGPWRDPCTSTFRKVMSLFNAAPKDDPARTNVSVTVTANGTGFPESALPRGHKTSGASYVYARTDQDTLKAFDASTLEPVGIARQTALHPLLKGPMSAAHAKSDPVTRDVFNFNLEPGRRAVYRIFKTSASTGETEILAAITGSDIPPAYMHSFFITENYIVFCIWSAHLAALGTAVLLHKNVVDAFSPFDKSKPVKWFVIDRKQGRGVVASFESRAAFCFHTVNAYETASSESTHTVDIICDLLQYDNLDVFEALRYDQIKSSSPTVGTKAKVADAAMNLQFVRYKLPSIARTTDIKPLSTKQREHNSPLPPPGKAEEIMKVGKPFAGDLPTINPSRIAKTYRYMWNPTFSKPQITFCDGLAKIDTHTGDGIRWENPVGHTPGETIFVANPEGVDEDDGVLLSIVLDGYAGSSYLLCLDARTMKELGRADCAGPVAFTFHGQHVASGKPTIVA